jgi:hypothetical protein
MLAACGYDPRSALLLLAICCAGGCGRGDWGTAEGVVTLGVKPVGPGTLIFEPTDQAETRSGIAHFGEDGRYENLRSAGNEAGLPAGEYRIRVQAGGEESFGEEQAGPPPPSAIPPQYLNYGAGLTAKIEPGDNEIDFELER